MVDMTSTSEDKKECPLCMDGLDYDDLHFYPCACLYQICRFCWDRLINEGNGLCPVCRVPYNSEKPAAFKPPTAEEVAKRKKEKKKQELQKKQKTAENRKHLADVRVLQKNLVFVLNLPMRLADKEVLKGSEYFGKYGKVYKVIINKNPLAASQPQQTVSGYVTYFKSEDALRAIIELNRLHIDNRYLKASLGTTKYCSQFLKGVSCTKHECMYLHDYGEEAASFTKDEMSQGRHTEYEQKLLENFQASQAAANSFCETSTKPNPFVEPARCAKSMPPGLKAPQAPDDGAGDDSPSRLCWSNRNNNSASLTFDRAPGNPLRLTPPQDTLQHPMLGTNGAFMMRPFSEDAPTLDFDPVSEAQHGLALAMETEKRSSHHMLNSSGPWSVPGGYFTPYYPNPTPPHSDFYPHPPYGMVRREPCPTTSNESYPLSGNPQQYQYTSATDAFLNSSHSEVHSSSSHLPQHNTESHFSHSLHQSSSNSGPLYNMSDISESLSNIMSEQSSASIPHCNAGPNSMFNPTDYNPVMRQAPIYSGHMNNSPWCTQGYSSAQHVRPDTNGLTETPPPSSNQVVNGTISSSMWPSSSNQPPPHSYHNQLVEQTAYHQTNQSFMYQPPTQYVNQSTPAVQHTASNNSNTSCSYYSY